MGKGGEHGLRCSQFITLPLASVNDRAPKCTYLCIGPCTFLYILCGANASENGSSRGEADLGGKPRPRGADRRRRRTRLIIPAETSRNPDFWLLVAEEDGRVLTVGGDRAPAVFSGEGEAELFLHLEVGGDGRRIIRTSPRELASLLCGPSFAGARRVALDPSPEMLAGELPVSLISVGKHRFLERFAERDLRGTRMTVAP